MSGMLRNNLRGLSRREFLASAVAGGGAMLVDPRVAQVMSGTVGIDMHNPQRGR